MSPYLPKSPTRPWLPAKSSSTRPKSQRHTTRTPLYNTSRWQRTRKLLLEAEPICRSCKEMTPPRTTVASVADHILNYNQHRNTVYKDPNEFFNIERLQSLCSSCHARKSSKEGRYK
jgi:5-methylcytosine-specific restriction endonuclease McrA